MPEESVKELKAEIEELRAHLEEAKETLDAIKRGEVDGLVVSTPKGEQVYTITGAEKPYRALIEEMREGAVMLSDDNTVLYCNGGFAKMVKQPIEKIVGVNIESLVCPTYTKPLEELLFSARERKAPVAKEIALQTKENTVVPTLMSVNSLKSDTLNNTFLVVTDLTEHMSEEVKEYTQELEQAQIALSESEQRWATTLASIGDAVIATDTLGKVKFMNGVAEDLTGWTLKEASGKSIHEVFKILNAFTRKTVDDPVFKVLEKGMIVGLANHTVLVRRDGTEIAIDDSGAPIRDKEGKITGVVLIFRDITERRKAEEALRISELRFRSLAENAPDVIMRFNPDLRVMYLNPKVEAATGVSAERFVGKTNEEMGMPKELVEMWNNMFRKARESKQAQQQEFDFPSPDGSKTYDLRVVPEYDEKDSLMSFLGISRDITERKKAEETLKQAQSKLKEYASNLEKLVEERTKQLKDAERMVAIGQTAGMVGHDIRNPLQSILSELYLAKSELSSMPESSTKSNMIESIENIEIDINYINKIVQDLQDFARPIKPVTQEVDLQAICLEVLQRNQAPDKVRVSCVIDPEVKRILSDPDPLKRVLTNLVTNAIQAMPKGGELNIKAHKVEGNTVITVQDTGVGIPDEIRSKIFTPLVTTKAKGQGFGLAVVKRFTEAIGGEVTFESEIGKGTTFTMNIPQRTKSA